MRLGCCSSRRRHRCGPRLSQAQAFSKQQQEEQEGVSPLVHWALWELWVCWWPMQVPLLVVLPAQEQGVQQQGVQQVVVLQAWWPLGFLGVMSLL